MSKLTAEQKAHFASLLNDAINSACYWTDAGVFTRRKAKKRAIEAYTAVIKYLNVVTFQFDPAKLPERLEHEALLLEAYEFGQFADDFNQPLVLPLRAAIRTMLDNLQVDQRRFFIEHDVWHDRTTGQHLYTQDQMDVLSRENLALRDQVAGLELKNDMTLDTVILLCESIRQDFEGDQGEATGAEAAVGNVIDAVKALKISQTRIEIPAPQINVKFVADEHDIFQASTYPTVNRVEREDDGSYTAVVNYWPSSAQTIAHDALAELLRLRDIKHSSPEEYGPAASEAWENARAAIDATRMRNTISDPITVDQLRALGDIMLRRDNNPLLCFVLSRIANQVQKLQDDIEKMRKAVLVNGWYDEVAHEFCGYPDKAEKARAAGHPLLTLYTIDPAKWPFE